ncbi:PH domain-containing protein [Halapricum desulfuricans]|uniref:Putative membrane protein, contains bPH2 (Bacterial pleckstrin homology) domain n=1 Tax=Halapricum desulfuricans TaxID=2841257 RepID=A0A897NC90_9EURY|nr:PH domain-containing protein [Halapricum desulfuricans]QSG10001.1 putative membrane protein, contains bPH2 (bacterial pleckstrin homology) domain [Halapricum desulfuricans]
MQLDPLSIPYRAVESGLQAIVGIAIAGIAGAGSVGGAEGIAVFGVVLVVGIALSIGWQVAYYRRFEYRLTGDTFDIDSGVLSRREREIPYGRIQNVDIRQNVLQRALGIAEVRLETAGGGQTEARLRYVDLGSARHVQEEVSRRKRGERDGYGDEETAATDQGATLFELDDRELVILGIVSMDLRLLSIIAVPLSFVGPSVLADVAPTATASIVVVVLGIVALVVASALFSAALSMARYYGFVLTDRGEEYRYERGLLQRFSGSIPKDKVQTITLTENVIARRLGYASLSIETAGYGGASQESTGSQSAIPIAERDHAVALAGRIEDFESLSFERAPKRARERYAVRYGLVLAALIAIAYGVVRLTALSFPWYALFGGVALVPVAAHLKWCHRGYRLEDDYVITRNGFWSRRITIVPIYRIQTLVTAETVFQRRRDLATLVVDTAGTYSLVGEDSKAVDIDVETADRLSRELADDLQEAVVEYRRRRDRASAVSSGEDVPDDANAG